MGSGRLLPSPLEGGISLAPVAHPSRLRLETLTSGRDEEHKDDEDPFL